MKKPGGTAVLAVLAVVFVAFLTPKLIHVYKLEKRSDEMAEAIKKLQAENQALERELKLLREDPVYLERVARQKFNKAKEGEIVYKVVRE